MATNNPYGWMGNPGQQAPQYNYNRTPYQAGAGGSGLGYGGNQYQGTTNLRTRSPNLDDWGPGGQPQQNQNQSQTPPYQPQQNQGFNDLMDQWRGSPFSNTSYYGNKDQSMNADRYATNYGVPMGNLLLQEQAQRANEQQFGATFGEQQFINRDQSALNWAGSRREDIGLDYGIWSDQANRDMTQQQFGATMGLNYAQLGQQGDIASMQNQTALKGLENQMGIASMQNQTSLRGLENQMSIAGMQNQTELAGQRNQYGIASMQDKTNQMGINVGAQSQKHAVDTAARTAAAELGLDYAKLSQDQKQFVDSLALQKLTQQQTYGIQQGQLGVQQGAEQRLGRQQSLDEAFRRAQMTQEAQLMRENYANQMMQSRYSAFGRAQAPNFRNVASWR